MNISSQGYLCNLLQKPLLYTAFHTSCSHSFSSQGCVSNTSELVWRLTGWCSEMGLPAGAGLALNVRILFGYSCLRDRKQSPCQPFVGLLFITNISSLGNTGKSGRGRASLLGRATGGHRVALSFCGRETLTPWSVSSLNFSEARTGKNGAVEDSWWALFILWSQRQSDWGLLLSDGSCLADGRWAVRRALLPKAGIVAGKHRRSRCACQEGSFN